MARAIPEHPLSDIVDQLLGALRKQNQDRLEAFAMLNPLLGTARVSIEDPASGQPSDLQLAALRFVTQWDTRLVSRLAEATLDYCRGFQEEVGATEPVVDSASDIFKFMRLSVIIVPLQARTNPVIRLEFECDWEPEHGLEWVIEAPESIRYVGPFRMTDDWLDDTDPGYANFLR